MSMGYFAAYADTVTDEFVEKICPKEFKAFMGSIDKNGTSLDEVAQFVDCEDEVNKDDLKALCVLRKAFEKKTKLGLELHYHSSEDEGDRHDEISGSYWSLNYVYQKTPAGKKYDKQIERKFFVTFG